MGIKTFDRSIQRFFLNIHSDCMPGPKKRTTGSGDATGASQLRGDDAEKERIMDDLTELYNCRPTKRIFDTRWHPDAVFEDALVRAEGRSQYEAQWCAMPWLFSESRLISRKIILSMPRRLGYSQVQEYTLKFIGKKLRVESVIELDLDDSARIVRMVDKWNGEELPTRYGTYLLRRLNGMITPWLVKIPKE